MADRKFDIVVVLNAMDKMSRVFDEAIVKSTAKLAKFQKQADNLARKSFGVGRDAAAMGIAAGAALMVPIKAFSDLEDAGLRLKSVMLKDGNVVDQHFDRINQLALKLGDQLPGTTADFQRMFAAMLSGGVPAQSVLDGVGEAAAHMAVVLNMSYESTASFASKLKTASGVADNEMNSLLDTLVKVSNVLPGADASEKATQLEEAFARSGGQLKNFGLQGLEASKQIATLYAMLIRGGAHGETVGTGFGKILESFYDKNKMSAFNSMAASMGLNFDFIDKKTGEFKGVENMVAQFDKMKNLTTLQRTNLITALAGDGQDSNFIKTFANLGIAGYNEMARAINQQATLDTRTSLIGDSIANKWEAATGTLMNSLAKFGETLKPTLVFVVDKLNALAITLGKWVETHPRTAKWIGMAVAGFAALATVVGTVAFTVGSFARVWSIMSTGFSVGLKAISMLRTAFTILMSEIELITAALAANPILAAAGALALTAYLIIRHWDKVKKWFQSFFEWMRNNRWAQVAAWIANPFVGAAITIGAYWDKLKLWAKFLHAGLKYEFIRLGNWLTIDLPNKLKNAGKNMMLSLWNGIKSMAMAPINGVKWVAQKIRDLFPFSPAKDGPLRDIHKIKLVETIAQSVKAAPLVNAMKNVAGSVAMAGGPSGNGGGHSGAPTLHYAPVITLGAGQSPEDFHKVLKTHARDIMKMLEDMTANKKRLAFE